MTTQEIYNYFEPIFREYYYNDKDPEIIPSEWKKFLKAYDNLNCPKTCSGCPLNTYLDWAAHFWGCDSLCAGLERINKGRFPHCEKMEALDVPWARFPGSYGSNH